VGRRTGMAEGKSVTNPKTLDYKFQVVTDEWKHCQTHIGRLDNIRLGIRGWAIALVSAFVGVAATERLPLLMLLAVGAMIFCWYNDAASKVFQEVFKTRSRKIEAYLRSDTFSHDLRADKMTFEAPHLSDAEHEAAGARAQFDLLIHWGTRPTILTIYLGLIVLCVSAFGALNLIAPPLQPGPQAPANSPGRHVPGAVP
jgi:hypothetical protein